VNDHGPEGTAPHADLRFEQGHAAVGTPERVGRAEQGELTSAQVLGP
jgi:hypothetical protein